MVQDKCMVTLDHLLWIEWFRDWQCLLFS